MAQGDQHNRTIRGLFEVFIGISGTKLKILTPSRYHGLCTRTLRTSSPKTQVFFLSEVPPRSLFAWRPLNLSRSVSNLRALVERAGYGMDGANPAQQWFDGLKLKKTDELDEYF